MVIIIIIIIIMVKIILIIDVFLITIDVQEEGRRGFINYVLVR